jgi:Fic family protein
MPQIISSLWQGDADMTAGLPRKDRRSCRYEAYVPDLLAERPVALDGAVAADVADAEASIIHLNHQAQALADTEALARLLLRAESVASSRIEGLEIGPRRLLQAEAAQESGAASTDVTATEVLGNIEAMVYAVGSVGAGGEITLEHLLEMHRRLFAGSRLAETGGQIRTVQNWIGGSSYNPCSAAFVPPPPEFVRELLLDLCRFCNEDSLPAVVQAALAHAQFETIHPFVDGNGRTGRALVHLILKRRGLAPRVLPPVSLVLATWSTDYIDGLQGMRHRGDASSAEAHAGLNAWVGLFATACRRAAADAGAFDAQVHELEVSWRRRLAPVRANSATDLLVRALPGAPILTVKSARRLLGRGAVAVNEAVRRLADAGILTQTTVGRRNRAFEARELIDAFVDFERRLASPVGDTRVAPPTRRVPRRRPD